MREVQQDMREVQQDLGYASGFVYLLYTFFNNNHYFLFIYIISYYVIYFVIHYYNTPYDHDNSAQYVVTRWYRAPEVTSANQFKNYFSRLKGIII